ncbi:hypothetical protein CWI39_1324p0010, partial [Hamiltosporidium magnivora]
RFNGNREPVIDKPITEGVNYKDYREDTGNRESVVENRNKEGVNYRNFRNRRFNEEKEGENMEKSNSEGCNEAEDKDECIKKEDGLEIGSALHIGEGNKEVEGDGVQYMLLNEDEDSENAQSLDEDEDKD